MAIVNQIDTSKMEMIPITHTNLNLYKQCPRRYYETYIAKTTKFESSPALEEGNLAHGAIEDYLKNGTPIPQSVSYMQRYADMIDAYRNRTFIDANGVQQNEFKIEVELGMYLNSAWKPCGYRASKELGKKFIWCKADVLAYHVPTGTPVVFDWKTGKPKDDQLQAVINGFCAAQVYGSAKVRCIWAFVKHDNSITTDLDFTTSDQLTEMMHLINQLRRSYVQNDWRETRNSLCKGWCNAFNCRNNGRCTNGAS